MMQNYDYNPNQYGYRPPKPDNYLIWAILEILFCCMPLGIVGLIYSTQVDTLYNAGRYAEAETASDTAKKYLKWGLWGGLALYGLYVVFVGIYFFMVVGLMALQN